MHRNYILFWDKTKSIIKVVSTIVSRFNEWNQENKHKSIRGIRTLVISDLTPMGFFDGVAQEEGLKCGVGAMSRIYKSNKIKINMNCGRGINTCAELLALWELLWVA